MENEKMKMGRWMVWGLVILMVASCCKEGIGEEGNNGNSEPILVSFSIGTPASDEVEYTRATQDASETRINSLTVYDFLVTDKDTLFESVQYLVEAGDGATTPKAGQFLHTDAGATACLSLHAPKNTTHVFAFVANEEKTHFDSIIYKKTLPMDSLRWTAATRKLKDGGDCGSLVGDKGAVMTGNTVPLNLPGDLSDTDKMKVKLYRIVARVDVKNEVADTQDLVIENVSARNCAPMGYLFEWSSSGIPTAEKRPKGYTAPIAMTRNPAVTTGDLQSLKKGQTCGKVLYLYEYPTTETLIPTLILAYTLNGVSGTMEVEMTSGGKRINIKRNRKYTLVVGGSSTTRMVCSVESNETTENE